MSTARELSKHERSCFCVTDVVIDGKYPLPETTNVSYEKLNYIKEHDG